MEKVTAIVYIYLHTQKYPYSVHMLINGAFTGYCRFCANWNQVNEALSYFNATLVSVKIGDGNEE